MNHTKKFFREFVTYKLRWLHPSLPNVKAGLGHFAPDAHRDQTRCYIEFDRTVFEIGKR